jgi:alpha-N-arabinofuranosidase
VDAAAVLGKDGGVTIFAVNRDMQDAIPLECDMRAFGNMKIAEHIVLHHDDVKAVNTEENPDNVAPKKGRGGKAEEGRVSVRLPALSWNVIRLARA